MPSVLITGGRGFLGRAAARAFRADGWRVVGLGHGGWTGDESAGQGFDAWHEADVSLAGLQALGDERFDVVVHCAANSAVDASLRAPLDAFRRTVHSTAELLEHLRGRHPGALVVYPSSAAVYGAAGDRPLHESDPPNPVSPYGFHKLMTETLLAAHAACFGQRAIVVRFFSIYGPGLAKQLLWDAAGRLATDAPEVSFWGTGDETRDWIHVDDAAALLVAAARSTARYGVVNGGGGERVTVAAVLAMLRAALGATPCIAFDGRTKPGDPLYYHADIEGARALGWRPAVPLATGIEAYARWWKAHHAAHPQEASP
jgi:UDP-glucose 4-epimerase